MADLIDRQEAIDGILRFMPEELKADATSAERVHYSAWQCALNCAESYVRTMPSAGVHSLRTAAWVGIDDFPHEDWECSACGHLYIGYHEPSKYCPGCGARMDGAEDG